MAVTSAVAARTWRPSAIAPGIGLASQAVLVVALGAVVPFGDRVDPVTRVHLVITGCAALVAAGVIWLRFRHAWAVIAVDLVFIASGLALGGVNQVDAANQIHDAPRTEAQLLEAFLGIASGEPAPPAWIVITNLWVIAGMVGLVAMLVAHREAARQRSGARR
jgi:hypothetical protein